MKHKHAHPIQNSKGVTSWNKTSKSVKTSTASDRETDTLATPIAIQLDLIIE